MPFFNTKTAAERYLAGRPDFHPVVIDHAKNLLNITQKLPAALDVGCGTGLSTKALLHIVEEVYGTDVSEEMLQRAHAKERIRYCLAPAEALPFEDNKFNLLTVSSAVHWFDIDLFLNEAGRVLKPGGWLLIYQNYFTGKMEGNVEFLNWADGVYWKRFPSPPRNNNYDWSAENLASKHFSICAPDDFENDVTFNKTQLITYLTTQSNVEAVIESGMNNYEEVESWLKNELMPFFNTDDTRHTFNFGNRLKYLQNIKTDERANAL